MCYNYVYDHNDLTGLQQKSNTREALISKQRTCACSPKRLLAINKELVGITKRLVELLSSLKIGAKLLEELEFEFLDQFNGKLKFFSYFKYFFSSSRSDKSQ
jgi:hypothetical protein